MKQEEIKVKVLSSFQEKKQELKNLLTNQLKLQDDPITEQIFQTDIVLEMRINSEMYSGWDKKIQLVELVNRVPEKLLEAYEQVFTELSKEMDEKGESFNKKTQQNQMRQFSSIIPLSSDYSEQQCKRLRRNLQLEYSNNEIQKTRIFKRGAQEKQIFFFCKEQYYSSRDAFTIQYNALIYCLQNICGFQTKAFLISDQKYKVKREKEGIQKFNDAFGRKIFILLRLPHKKLIQIANSFQIQKEIDYRQIDPFLNQPKDRANRILKFHPFISDIQELEVMYELIVILFNAIVENQQSEDMMSDNFINVNRPNWVKNRIKGLASDYKFSDFLSRKTCERKLGLSLKQYDKNKDAESTTTLNQDYIERYKDFNGEMKEELQKLLYYRDHPTNQIKSYFQHIQDNKAKIQPNSNKVQDPDDLTLQECEYLYKINRKKWNAGVKKKMIQLKKQRKYFSAIEQNAKKFGFKIFDQPTIYVPFNTFGRKFKFFDKLSHMLLFKEQVISPFGDLSFFSKSQRIKLSYLALRNFMKIENFSKINLRMFALENDFQKYGDIGDNDSTNYHSYYDEGIRRIDPEIEGGLDGVCLVKSWYQIRVWENNYEAIRNYLGEEKTFQIFIKTKLIFLFMLLGPFGILGEILKRQIVRGSSDTPLAQFLFNIPYLLIVVIFYGIFLELYNSEETIFMDNYIDKSITLEYRNDYQGPYLREIATDNSNIYDENNVPFKFKIMRKITVLVVIMILGAFIGFYYGMRAAIVQMSLNIGVDSQAFYLFRGVHLIAYSIFFISILVLYRLFIANFFKWITTFQNWSAQKSFQHSLDLKLFLFIIGVEIIGPIDLVFIQSITKSDCFNEQCYTQLQAYIYSKYFIEIVNVLINSGMVLFKIFKSKSLRLAQNIQNKLQNIAQEESRITFQFKLGKFLAFVNKQSEKDNVSSIMLVDEVVSLFHFCTFVNVFPLSAAVSLVSVFTLYNIERQHLISNSQRPIPKSQPFDSLFSKISILGHWLIFYNISVMILVKNWLQYLVPSFTLAILTPEGINPSSILVLKYTVIICVLFLYEIILAIVRKIVRSRLSPMQKRKAIIYKKYRLQKSFKTSSSIHINPPYPLETISRAYIHEKDQDYQKDSDQCEEDIQQQQQPIL